MWIDTEKIRFDGFDPNEPSDPWTDEDESYFAEIDERERQDQERREAMERDQAAIEIEELI
jgi:hypothetical protein